MTAPFLKWAGGKARLLPELLSRLPADVDERRHVEPFLGGGALFFARQPKRALLADVNPRLVATYHAVRDDVESVVNRLSFHALRHSKQHYLDSREAFNTGGLWSAGAEVAALFIYLNKTGFNGLYRENLKGEFNVPWGKRAMFSLDYDGLREASRALRGVEIVCADFEWVCEQVGPQDFVYLDPPYDPASETANFATYVADGFDRADQERARVVLEALYLLGVPAMVSNHDTLYTRELYRALRVESVTAPRSIGAKTREPARELIGRTW